MGLKVLACYKIGKASDSSCYSPNEFKEHATQLKKEVPEISGVEVRLCGRLSKKGTITHGLQLHEISDVCNFISKEFDLYALHLSQYGLAILRGTPVRGKRIRDAIRFIDDNFYFVVGHHGEHENLWGQAMQDSYLNLLKKAARKKRSLEKLMLAVLDGGEMPARLTKKFLIENGFEPYNIKATVHDYAQKNGLDEVTDLGHFIMGNFDEDPAMGGATHDSIDAYVTQESESPVYRASYLQSLGHGTVHAHVHGCRPEPQKVTIGTTVRTFKRLKDHYPFVPANVSDLQRGLLERLLQGARPTLRSCTIELDKKVNSPENVKKSMEFFEACLKGA